MCRHEPIEAALAARGHGADLPKVSPVTERVGGFFLLLVVWWTINALVLGGEGIAWAYTIFFGTIPASIWIMFLEAGDYYAGRFKFPWAPIILAAIIAVGCVVLFALRTVETGYPMPAWNDTRYAEKMFFHVRGYAPWFTVAGILFVLRLAASSSSNR